MTHWDADLEYYHSDLERMAEKLRSFSEVRRTLQSDIHKVLARWKKDASASHQAKVETIYRMWCDIRPSKAALKEDGVKTKLVGPQDDPDSISYWGEGQGIRHI